MKIAGKATVPHRREAGLPYRIYEILIPYLPQSIFGKVGDFYFALEKQNNSSKFPNLPVGRQVVILEHRRIRLRKRKL